MCICGSGGYVFAQQVAPSATYTVRENDDFIVGGVVGDTGIVVTYNDEQIKWWAFDGQMRLAAERVLMPATNRVAVDVYPYAGKAHFVYTHTQAGREIAYLQAYNGMGIPTDSSTLLELPAFNGGEYSLVLSRSKAYGIVVCSTASKVYVYAYSTAQRTVYFKDEWTVSNPDRLYFIQALVDDAGNVWALGAADHIPSRRNEASLVVRYHHRSSQTTTQSKVNMQGKLMCSMVADIDAVSGNLLAGGLWTHKWKTYVDGPFYLRLSPEKWDAPILAFSEIDDSFKTKITGKKPKKNIEYLQTRKLAIRNDGGILLLAEHSYYYARQNTPLIDKPSLSNENLYYYNDVILWSLDAQGIPEWHDILRKRQYSQNDDGAYSSFFLVKGRSKLMVLYNEDLERDVKVVAGIVGAQGIASTRNVVVPPVTNTEPLYLLLRYAYQANPSQLFALHIQGKRFKLVRITLPTY